MSDRIVIGDPSGFILGDSAGNYVGGEETFLPLTGYHNGKLPFFIVEISVSRPGSNSISFGYGHGSHPHGALGLLTEQTDDTFVIGFSDIGYVTETSPVDVYLPYLDTVFEIESRVTIDPSQIGIVWSNGSIRLINADGYFNVVGTEWNSDSREVVIKYGEKVWDDARGIFTDPAYATLRTVYRGLARPWELSENYLEIPLRDPSYWMERSLQREYFTGAGLQEGHAELSGISKPYSRGYSAFVPLIQIDIANNIWSFNGGPGQILTVYEGAYNGFIFESTTTNLWSGSTTAGKYRVDETKGLIQFGSPVDTTKTIAAEIIGHFQTAGAVTNIISIIKFIITEDLAVPSAFVNTTSFDDAAALYNYDGGIHFSHNENPSGIDALGKLLSSCGAKLVQDENGKISIFVLRAISNSASIALACDTSNIMDLVPRTLSQNIYPPPSRLRLGYKRNNLVMKDNISSLASDAMKKYVALEMAISYWTSGAVAIDWLNSNDTEPFGGFLKNKADADVVVSGLGTLLRDGLRSYDVTLPLDVAIGLKFGDVVSLLYTFGNLTSIKKGQVVGRGSKSGEMSMIITVLV